ncbi:hypothetical protein [Hominenteromicrobium sp.]|uniref:hypothetical protein n=1 Tax=Hominenteromicrobium sp. TaxID=3073581 RepID=UPI00399A0451
MLILDEAASSIDTRTRDCAFSARVCQADARTHLVRRRTPLIDASRDLTLFSSMRDGDSIVEQGDHESLLAKNGFYAELYHQPVYG